MFMSFYNYTINPATFLLTGERNLFTSMYWWLFNSW